MPAAIRQGDKCSGHGCFPPRANTSWSTNVFVNGLGWHREDDGWEKHKCGDSEHAGSLSDGSGTVYVNGKKAGRIGDPVSCGSAGAQGSGNVYAGG